MLPKPSLAKCCAASAQRRVAARVEVQIFLDANVLFSAAKSDGFVRRLLELLMADGHVLCADGYVAEEARRNLAAKGPQGLPALAALLDRLEVAAMQANSVSVTGLSALPEKDRPVVAAAARMACDALVTGDRTHFGRFYGRSLAGIAIHSPRTLAAKLL
ncbi:MAG: PIN domain-containing protein [Rhodospirillales bacterium]|nr:PIN domain-containing protein [Rhodospirillales bacterium]